MDETTTDPRACACGCGQTPRRPTSRFCPGHHKQRPDPFAGRYAEEDGPLPEPCWVWRGYRLPGGGLTGWQGRVSRRSLRA